MREKSVALLEAGRTLWRRVVPHGVRRATHLAAASSMEARALRSLTEGEPAPSPGPLVVSGLFCESKGVSQGARLTLAGLQHAGLHPIVHDLRQVLERPRGTRLQFPTTASGGVWLLHANAPEALHALNTISADAWRGRYRIGYWAWELPRAPVRWARAARAFHEIWTPSRFVAEAMAVVGVTSTIRVIPHPTSLAATTAGANRAVFGISAGATAILCMGDLNSSADRKNLLGSIAIYQRAFPKPDGRTVLVIKTQADDEHRHFQAAARNVAGGRDDIVFRTGVMPHQQVYALIASCDVLLSPHRAEGFGLSLAEAFLLGVPSLATGWSGNLDFMDGIDELLIRSDLVPVRDQSGIYREKGQVWAEPDAADAANKLRTLVASKELRAKLAARGRAAVERMAEPWARGGTVAQILGPHLTAQLPAAE